jgi:hypothetical protein
MLPLNDQFGRSAQIGYRLKIRSMGTRKLAHGCQGAHIWTECSSPHGPSGSVAWRHQTDLNNIRQTHAHQQNVLLVALLVPTSLSNNSHIRLNILRCSCSAHANLCFSLNDGFYPHERGKRSGFEWRWGEKMGFY